MRNADHPAGPSKGTERRRDAATEAEGVDETLADRQGGPEVPDGGSRGARTAERDAHLPGGDGGQDGGTPGT